MYEGFFGLHDKPFALTPNPRFVFYSQQYREAEGQLLYGINNREGFMLVTGQPGTGKTTLCRDLIEKLDHSKIHSALVFNPFLNAHEMLAWTLLQIHNHAVVSAFFAGVRASLAAGPDVFERDCRAFHLRYEPDLPVGQGERPRARGYHYRSEGGDEGRNRPAWGQLDAVTTEPVAKSGNAAA